jgi:hypothetical protein
MLSPRRSHMTADCHCREAAALKAALRKNEALLRGLETAHELANVVAADAQVQGLSWPCVPGGKTPVLSCPRSSPARNHRFRDNCQASLGTVGVCVHVRVWMLLATTDPHASLDALADAGRQRCARLRGRLQ